MTASTYATARALPLSVAVMIAACGGESATGTEPEPSGRPVAQVVSGDAQVGTVGTTLSEPLVLAIVGGDGRPVTGVSVGWSIGSGGGSLSSATSETDAQGRAQVQWTLGTVAGDYAVVASAQTLSASVTFRASASPGPVATLTVRPAEVVLGTWGETESLTTSVQDEYANPIPDAQIVWTSSDSGVVLVDGQGELTSWLPGDAEVFALAGGVEGSVAVAVRRQLNPACHVSDPVPVTQPATGPIPAFSAGQTFEGPALQYSANTFAVVDLTGDDLDELVAFTSTDTNEIAGPDQMEGAVRVWQKVGLAYVDVTSDLLAGEIDVDGGPRAVAVADMNADGIQDLLAVQHGYDAAPFPGAHDILLLSQQDGTHADFAASNLQPYDKGFTHSATLGDVDCDGVVDLLQNNVNGGEAAAHLQIHQGGGTFGAEDARLPSFMAGQARETFSAATFIDFDLDGDADLALGGWPGGGGPFRDRLLVNDGFGSFRDLPAGTLPGPPYGFGANAMLEMKTLDADGDGLPDILLTSTNTAGQAGRIGIWRNQGDGSFADATADMLGDLTEWSSWIYRIRVSDFNGDGWDDFSMSFAYPCLDAVVYVNRGGTFVPVSVAGSGCKTAAPFRSAGDGIPDLVLLGPGADVPQLVRSSIH